MDFRIFHVFNRGVEKREIFLDDSDRVRFIHDLYEFNDKDHAREFNRRLSDENHKRDKLVKLLAFCLMPNHHHLLCEDIEDGGTSLFIKKLHGGYARAFNEKHKRSGYLFQGKFKRISINTDSRLLQVVCYIHANPLSLWKSDWREHRLTKKEIYGAIDFLQNYRWSSHLDYLSIKNFPSITDREFLNEIFADQGGYEKVFIKWIEFFEEENIKEHSFNT